MAGKKLHLDAPRKYCQCHSYSGPESLPKGVSGYPPHPKRKQRRKKR